MVFIKLLLNKELDDGGNRQWECFQNYDIFK